VPGAVHDPHREGHATASDLAAFANLGTPPILDYNYYPKTEGKFTFCCFFFFLLLLCPHHPP